MKSERRHELQQNSLARVIENFPVYARHYADRILLVIVLIMLAIVIVRWRMNANLQREAEVADQLASAKASLAQLQQLPTRGPAEQLASARGQLIGDVTGGIENVANNSSDKDTKLRAQAMLTRGDLYWTLSGFPPIPGAATQPSLALPKSPDEYLQSAQDTYRQVLSSYPTEKSADVAANFGLAAIAENRLQWDEARKIYEQIKSSDADTMYKTLADSRLQLLPEMEKPMLLGSLTTQPSGGDLSGGPLDTSSLTTPTTLPITVAAPTTAPTAAPATKAISAPAAASHPTTQIPH